MTDALKLAEMLEQSRHKETLDAAAELRRQHDLIADHAECLMALGIEHAALKAEVERWKDNTQGAWCEAETLRAELETPEPHRSLMAMKAEVESLRAELAQEQARFRVARDLRLQDEADAARYRWLRDTPWPSSEFAAVIQEHRNAVWDDTIDRAMKEAS